MVYPLNGHPSWTNRARCWLTSLKRPTTLTTTPSRHPVVYKYHLCQWEYISYSYIKRIINYVATQEDSRNSEQTAYVLTWGLAITREDAGDWAEWTGGINMHGSSVLTASMRKNERQRPLSMRGGGLYFIPVWLQNNGTEPRTCTNETTWFANSRIYTKTAHTLHMLIHNSLSQPL